jgi:hypothetical protein
MIAIRSCPDRAALFPNHPINMLGEESSTEILSEISGKIISIQKYI